MAVGSSNDVLLTLVHAGSGLVPAALNPWLPLANEIANVTKTATGKAWIYSGLTKQAVDGVALGSILGHSLTATAEHGPVTGSIVFAANMGLTYWFPNKYFHSIMHGFPKLIPASVPALRKAAATPVGQGMVGVSMILIIERLLEKSEQLAEAAPHLFQGKKPAEEISPPAKPDEKMRKALAAFLLDGAIRPPRSKENIDPLLIYVLGASKERGLFSSAATAAGPAPPKLTPEAKRHISQLLTRDLTEVTQGLLLPGESALVRENLRRLSLANP